MSPAPPGTTQPLRPRTPAPLPSPPPEVATDPQQKGPSHKRPSGQECGPTPNKGEDQPAQHNQNTPHKGGHMTSTPSHPRTHGAEPTECPAPEARQSSRPHDAPPRPLPCPRERHRPSKPKGATERPQHTEQRGHTPIRRRRPTYIQVSQAKTIEPSQTADPPEPAPQQHHPSFCAFVGAWRGPLTPSTPNPPGAIQQTSKPHPSMKPRCPTHSDARPAAPTPADQSRRAQDHHPNKTARHTVEDEMQQRAPKAKAAHKAHTAQMCPHQPPKNKAPHESAPPRKEDPHHPGPRTCPTPIPLPEAAPQKDPVRGPQKAREPTEPKPKPIRKPRPIHPETSPASLHTRTMQTPPNPLPQTEKGPASVTGTKTRNQKPSLAQNQTTSPTIQAQPPHPRRKLTPIPTFEQLPEHIRHWTPRLTPPHPLPQTLLPASRMCSLKEGAPAMRWDLPASFGGPYAHRYTKGPRARAGRPGMHQP
ncbi:vegetative cell wall protein gp1-like [Girardinichthys multiradiatus]|uniref:vegetative cell wall protein gp1-like n=1 Tax=Girardinichthys multiradiatus TaxID=208333 RepID=UPI001FACF633|nr:vegetative cell wall protein gp1-like [Girardinichthys multiradiatus]